MEITVNGELTKIDGGATGADLAASFELTSDRVAVEVNERLVRRATFAETRLSPGDRVEIVTLVGGG